MTDSVTSALKVEDVVVLDLKQVLHDEDEDVQRRTCSNKESSSTTQLN